jgi:CheY-like chemotaxis protein
MAMASGKESERPQRPGQVTAPSLEIPIVRPALPPPTPSGLATALRGKTVLIVDDDVRNVFALTSALETYGLVVLYADNGADGIRLLSDHPEVNIVLMDAMMPDMDGNETTRRIRRLPQGERLPVVFLTAKAMPGDRESSLAAGATDYITKPVELDRLLSVINAWIRTTDVTCPDPRRSTDDGELPVYTLDGPEVLRS